MRQEGEALVQKFVEAVATIGEALLARQALAVKLAAQLPLAGGIERASLDDLAVRLLARQGLRGEEGARVHAAVTAWLKRILVAPTGEVWGDAQLQRFFLTR